jgi:hypothetical protein
MSKAGNFAAGLLGGYVGYKQQKEAQEERKADREMMQSILGKKKDDSASQPAAVAKTAMAEGAAAGDAVSSLSNADVSNRAAQSGFVSVPEEENKANGGMIGEMPKQYDRFGWQRQSFKKGTPSF